MEQKNQSQPRVLLIIESENKSLLSKVFKVIQDVVLIEAQGPTNKHQITGNYQKTIIINDVKKMPGKTTKRKTPINPY